MLRYLHTLSATLFYILGASLFLAYILAHNNIQASAALRFLQIIDMPTLLVGLLYGGLSMYRSLHDKSKGTSIILALALGFPLAALFLIVITLNFWN